MSNLTGYSLNPFSNDFLSLILSAGLLGAYQLFLFYRTRSDPYYTVQSVMAIARAAWTESIMADSKKGVLAIQTLRNSTMAATFHASTAILLIIGTLTLSVQGANFDSTLHALNVSGSKQTEIWAIKLMLLLVDLFVAFFSFAVAIRVFNLVGYMINAPASAHQAALSPRHVASHLNRAGRYYSVGMRAYYTLVPLVFWLFGPLYMLLSTIALLFILYHLDRAPRAFVFRHEKRAIKIEK